MLFLFTENSLQAGFRLGHGSLARVIDFKHGSFFCSETAHVVCRGFVGFKMNLMELYALLLMSEDKIRQEVLWTRCFTSCLCSWNPCPMLLPAPCFLSWATSLKCRHWFCSQVSIVPPFILHDRFCPRSPNRVHAKVSLSQTYS